MYLCGILLMSSVCPEEIRSPEARVTDSCVLPCGQREHNPGSLQDQYMS